VVGVRRRDFGLISIGAGTILGLAYLIFVQTPDGQDFDDLALQGRAVEDPEITRLTNDLLHDVTRSSLFLLTGALVLLALARRRPRLAFAVGAAVTGSVVTAEVLKLHLLERPDLGTITGIAENSFPSGHATIGMALSLGLVMVTPHRWRWLALLVAVSMSTLFGVGVLATGWHRPSDTLAAYMVCCGVFALVTVVLLGWNAGTPSEFGDVEERLSSGVMAVAGALVVVAVGMLFVRTIRRESVRTVDYSMEYVIVCVGLVVVAAAIVVGYHQLLRGVSLDPPRAGPPSGAHRSASAGPTRGGDRRPAGW
jgi:membrane-associated phospholipid phosphatase